MSIKVTLGSCLPGVKRSKRVLPRYDRRRRSTGETPDGEEEVSGKTEKITAWLKRERNRLKTGELLRQAKSRLVGDLNYYAITDNGPRCHSFRRQFRGFAAEMVELTQPTPQLHLGAILFSWLGGMASVRIVNKLDPIRRAVGSQGY